MSSSMIEKGANELKLEEKVTRTRKQRKLSTEKLKEEIDTLTIEGLELNLGILEMTLQDYENKKFEVLERMKDTLKKYKDAADSEEKVHLVYAMLKGERLLEEMIDRQELRIKEFKRFVNLL